jgi:mono/diheme cytochrome c family protein
MKTKRLLTGIALGSAALALGGSAGAQMRDIKEKMTLPQGNAADGIRKNLPEQVGPGRGDLNNIGSSIYVINRDPARAIRRGRQLFQRKFLPTQGFSGRDRSGNIHTDPSIGAGVVDSCAGCHGRPRGSAGFGGDVFTRPDSRDAPHLFGLGLQEQLGDEITGKLRAIRAGLAIGQTAQLTVNMGGGVTLNYGSITRTGATTFNTANVVGVDANLRVQPFFAQGDTVSIREFLVGAFNAEMGIQGFDPDLQNAAVNHQRVVTPSGMVLDGALDQFEAPPVSSANTDADGDGIMNELPVSLIDFEEFYLLHYFKPAKLTGADADQTTEINNGRGLFLASGCGGCHVPDLTIDRDRRIADVETAYNPAQGNPFNHLFATATVLGTVVNNVVPAPFIRTFESNPAFAQSAAVAPRAFVVRNFFADLKRHNLGPNFFERFHDNRVAPQQLFMTEALWGVGTSAPYGHDGRTHSLEEVILRHGGEAQSARDAFSALTRANKNQVLSFLNSLVLFSPDDTASNLAGINTNPPDPDGAGPIVNQGFPQAGHGAIALTVLFNNPADLE